MYRRNSRNRRVLYGLLALLLVCGMGAAYGQSSATIVWSLQANLVNYGNYVIRDFDVDQSNGDIWIAMDANAVPPPVSQVVKMDKDGNVLGAYGNELRDSGGTLQTDLQQDLWGVAKDPKTGYVYLGVDETTGTPPVNVGEVHIIDPSLTPPNVWLRKFATGMTTARGCAFSDDGMKFAVAGYSAQSPGKTGARLYTRNLNGTPGDFTDDTWDFAADLMVMGGYRGLGDYWGYQFSPRNVDFDRDGSIYVCGEMSAHKFSGTAPYPLIGEYCTYTGRYAIATDGSNNMFVTANADAAFGAASLRRVWAQSQQGVKLLAFVPRDVPGITPDVVSYIDIAYCCAFDRGSATPGSERQARLIVGGRDTSANYAIVDSYTVDLQMPATVNLSGRVVDSGASPIANAGVGYAQWWGNANWYARLIGKKAYVNAVGSDGRFTIPILADATYPLVIEIEAPGKLRQRLYKDPITADLDLGDVVLQSNAVDSLTWRPLQIAPLPATGAAMVERRGTDNGIVTMALRYGGRAVPVQDADSNSELCFRIGNRTEAAPPGGKSWDNYLYLDIDDGWWTPGADAWVTIEYMDKSKGAPDGWDALGGDADLSALDPAWAEVQFGKLYKHAPTSAVWKTRTFKASRASFANAMHDTNGQVMGGDLRLDAYKDYTGTAYVANTGPDWIKSVTVSKVEPAAEPNAYGTIAEAKAAGAGPVILNGKIMTAQWNGTVIYLGEPTRESGIRVNLFQSWAANWRVGRVCKVYGTLAYDAATGEPFISSDVWGNDLGASPPALGPLGTIGRSVGAVTGGLNMTGLKVGVWGSVTSVASDSFTVNDGSGDIKILIDASLGLTTWPTVGDFVAVIGIATLEGTTPPTATRIIKPWRTDNIVIVVDV